VVLAARRKDRLDKIVEEINKLSGGRAIGVECDTTKEEDQKRAFAAAEKEFGNVHFVIANAGLEGPGTPTLLEDDKAIEHCEAVMKVNFLGTIITLKYGTLALRRAGGGAIVAISSGAGGISPMGNPLKLPSEMSWSYGPTKSAIDQMVRNSAGLAAENIRVYSVAPHLYETDMGARVSTSIGMNTAQFAQLVNPTNPTPGDPAHLAKVFLSLFDESTTYLPGDLIYCDHDATYSGDTRYQHMYRHPSNNYVLDLTQLRDYRGVLGYEIKK